jgi:hypothetical protein
MGAPKQPRLKSPSKVGSGSHPQRAPKQNYFSTLMETPEGRELRKQWSTKRRKNAGRPKGTPDGLRKEQADTMREEIKKEAEKVVEIMAQKFGIEDDYAKEALGTAVEVMRMQGETRERLSAARLVLDFTKQKPVAKSEVAVAKAEDFLASLLVEDEDAPEAKEGS